MSFIEWVERYLDPGDSMSDQEYCECPYPMLRGRTTPEALADCVVKLEKHKTEWLTPTGAEAMGFAFRLAGLLKEPDYCDFCGREVEAEKAKEAREKDAN